MKAKGTDVMFVQETHSDILNEPEWRKVWGGGTKRGGVGILFSIYFCPVSFEVEHVVDGRLMVVRTGFEHFNIVFMKVYAPVKGPDRVQVLQVHSTVLNKVNVEDFFLLGGDFDCT